MQKKITLRILSALLLVGMSGCAGARSPKPPAIVFPSGAIFQLELAIDDQSRARGYMFREHIAPDEGMLFFFEEPGIYPFWMKNCKINLDIIWLDSEFRVTDVMFDVPPCDPDGECNNVMPTRQASYVLEVAGGVARSHGLARGDLLTPYLEKQTP
jgi:uncharacterized membrane protein (UPF0127 family)